MSTVSRCLLFSVCLAAGFGACSSPSDEDTDTGFDVETDADRGDAGDDASDLGGEDISRDPGGEDVTRDLGGEDVARDLGEDGSHPADTTDTADAVEPDVPVTPIDHYVGASVDLDTLERNGQALTDLNLAPLTHFSVGYARVSEIGTCTLSDADAASIRGLMDTAPEPLVILGVGGYANSSSFSTVAGDPAARARFASSCVALVAEYGFDGLQVEWSQPVLGAFPEFDGQPDDWANYERLLASTRSELDSIRDGLLLTIVGPADLTFTPSEELTAAVDQVDIVTLVTYDLSGPWSALTELTAPIYRRVEGVGLSVNFVTGLWLAAGVPASKLVLGYPLYGWGWDGVESAEIGVSSTGFAPGSGADAGVYSWDVLRNAIANTSLRRWDAGAQGAWALAPEGVFLSFDDTEVVQAKAAYVLEHGLRGLNGVSLGSDVQAELPSVAQTALAGE